MTKEQVQKWRERHNVSQSKLAEMLGVHWMTVASWEQGRQSTPPFLHLALAELSRRIRLKPTKTALKKAS